VTTAVDTNVMLDLLTPGAPFTASSLDALDQAANQGPVAICDAVYAELSAKFPNREDLDEFLRRSGVQLIATGPRALFMAGEAWRRYTRVRPTGIICGQCGAETQVQCVRCNSLVGLRQRVLSDFLIGAHSLVHADRLLTRDRGVYVRYFPDLELV